MRFIIYPYHIYSEGAANLADALETMSVRENGHYRPRRGDVIINWGNSRQPNWITAWLALNAQGGRPWVNPLSPVSIGHNKLLSFRAFQASSVTTVPWTTAREEVAKWMRDGYTTVARKYLESQEGKGIQLVEPGQEIPMAPLYTRYVPKKKEFRVHVVNGEAIDVQQKKRKDGEDADSRIRNTAGGWIFARENIVEPETLRATGVAAVRACGLDFGAVDIIWNQRHNTCYVLEVNTAPGIEGTTVNHYASAFRRMLNAPGRVA